MKCNNKYLIGIVLIGLTFLFQSASAQTLSLQIPTSDYNIGIQDSAVGRSVRVDVHKPSGKVVYIWCDKDASGTTRDIYCAIYNADMSLAVNRFRVNNNATNEQIYGYVKVNQQDNSFVVTWASTHSGNYEIYAKKISLNITDATSSAVTSATDVLMNGITSGGQYVPVAEFNYFTNELIIGYRDHGGSDGSGISSYFRRFDYSNASLTPVGNDVMINQYTIGDQYMYEVKVHPLTGEIITICSSITASGNYDIVRRVFTFNATTNSYSGLTEAIINNYNATTSGNQTVPVLTINSSTGNYMVTYTDFDESGNGVATSMFNSSHIKIINDVLVNDIATNNQLLPRVVWDEKNAFLIYFFNYSVSSFSTIKYRIFYIYGNSLSAVDTDNGALVFGGIEKNTYNYSGAQFYPAYNPLNNKIYLGYDVHRNDGSFSNGKSNGRVRVFQYIPFGAEPTPSLAFTYYAELKDELDASYYTTLNKDTLYFKYNEKYFPGVSGAPLNYKIYDFKRNVLATPALTKSYGMNYFRLGLKGILSLSSSNDNYYILEVTNDKGDVKMLRFKYTPDY